MRLSPALGALALVAAWAAGARAQEPGDEIRGDALRVFLDCNAFPCDFDYFRTEALRSARVAARSP